MKVVETSLQLFAIAAILGPHHIDVLIAMAAS